MITTTNCTSTVKHLALAVLTTFLFSVTNSPLEAQPVLSLTPVISAGLSAPIQLVNAGDGSNRAFIVQQGGSIRVYDAGFNFLSVFLTVSNVNFSGERGLLSMAFHPDYLNNGLFFVYYVNGAGDLELARYHVSGNPNIADAATKVIVLTIPHPTNSNHNGGELHFGNDGFLYLSTGDGGGAGDVPNNAQNTAVLLGKMLRLNVNTAAIAPFYTIPPGNPFGNEIFDLGLRNPFRWSFDRLTNDMWIGDVGQDSFEEINFRAAGSTGGVNYGWHCYEANNAFNTTGCGPISNYIFPVYNYPTQNPSAAVTGGVVYRGNVYPPLQGYNISADFYSGIFYKTISNGSGGWATSTQTMPTTGIADFGETENGELYAVSLTAGSVSRVGVTGTLPVIISSFTGSFTKGVGVTLRWQTSLEQQLHQFDIEYSSNGTNFTKLQTIPAKNKPAGAAYTFLHTIATDGSFFYRLKMIDTDGTAKYTAVIRVVVKSDIKNFISPSIITNGMLNLVTASSNGTTLELVNMNGVVLFKKNIAAQPGNIQVPVGRLPGGIYIARLYTASTKTEQKIIIP